MTMETTKKFKVGEKYSMRSICNQDCVWTYKVISRTDRTVELQQLNKDGKPTGDKARFRINKELTVYLGAECVKPLGTYSMAPTLKAE